MQPDGSTFWLCPFSLQTILLTRAGTEAQKQGPPPPPEQHNRGQQGSPDFLQNWAAVKLASLREL